LKIVWIEDETRLLSECRDFLLQESIEVYGASTLEEGERLIDEVKPSMLLVDWMLPNGASGIEICKLNEQRWRLPFIMVTAKGDEFDKVLALELGADDYLTKPFGLRELSARIKAVMRRSGRSEAASSTAEVKEQSIIRRGQLKLDHIRFQAEMDGRKLDLTKTEFLLLWTLASYPGRVFTRAQLMDEALGFGYLGYERTMDSHIRNLRRKLEENSPIGNDYSGDPNVHMYVETVYGVGYRFTEEV
jgi:DNA-binding response OmpR family regulator